MPLARYLIGLACYVCCIFAAASEPRPYIVDVQSSLAERGYSSELLELLLNASKAPDEIIQIRFADERLSQARWIAAVAHGTGNNVIWTMTNKAREETLKPIRFPLTKGLLGYRALVIRKGDEARFAAIKTQRDLVELIAGQGAHWPDTVILRQNNFRIVDAPTKENLYKMLAAKRFDFFPRGITEITLEKNLIRDQGLMVEPNILLHYPTDMYFFVNKNNSELATRLEKGWINVLKSGEFEKFFLTYSRMGAAMTHINTHKYRVIELENPFLSQETRKVFSALGLQASAKNQ